MIFEYLTMTQFLWALMISLAGFAGAGPGRAAEFVFSDFNATGFDYTFAGFSQQTGGSSVRVSDSSDGRGGAGLFRTLDLSAMADQRWAVDFTVNPGSGVDRFELELFDAKDNTGKWSFHISNVGSGVATRMVSANTLGQPEGGIGDWQNLDLANIRRLQLLGHYGSPEPFDISFDRIAIANLPPPPPYKGGEPNAPWRAEAAQRIDANRKADLMVRVVDLDGNPLPDATVHLEMQQHEFGFGSAVQAWRLRDSDPRHAMYKQKVAELFNIATLENNLKWPAWEGAWGSLFTQQGAIDAINWLREHGFRVRGHNVIWPGDSHLPQDVRTLISNAPLSEEQQQQLRERIEVRITDVVGRLSDLVDEWDVVNEPRANHDVMDVLQEGNLAMVDWFQTARTTAPGPRLYLNDYGILSSGGATNTSNQQLYYDMLSELMDNGAPIDGIGLQAHFNDGTLTGPEELWSILDRFAELGLDIQITEFDYRTTDEDLQAAFTRDFLTAIFAHEHVDDFVMWGFWESAMNGPDGAMFRDDWSIKPNGQVFLNLVFDEWWTVADLSTDENGTAGIRGFKGDYTILVSYGGSSELLQHRLINSGELVVTITPSLELSIQLEAGEVQLVIQGQPSQQYAVHASTDLITWEPIATVTTDDAGRAVYLDPEIPEFPFRFYRVTGI